MSPVRIPFDRDVRVRTISQRIIIGNHDISDFVLSGTTTKTLGDPAGTWKLILRPSILNNQLVNLGDISINDFCEIRVGVVSEKNKIPPLLMRGLVDAVIISEETSGGGEPTRSVIIQGRDLGKIFVEKALMPPIEFINQISITRYNQLLTNTKVAAKSGSKLTYPIQTYTEWTDNLFSSDNGILTTDYLGFDSVNGFLKSGGIKPEVNIPMVENSTNGMSQALVLNLQYSTMDTQGSLWQWMNAFIPAPLMEFFLEDCDDDVDEVSHRGKTICHLRWAPFRTKWGAYPSMGRETEDHMASTGALPSQYRYFIDIDKFVRFRGRSYIGRNQIMQKTLSRSDGDTRTFFFTRWRDYDISASPSTGTQFPTEHKKLDCLSSPQLTNHNGPDNYGGVSCSLNNGNRVFNPMYDIWGMSRFGLKPMIVNVPFWNSAIQTNQAEQQKDPKNNTITRVLDNINQWMYDCFTQQHNLFNGSIVMIGNANIRIGQELFIVPEYVGAEGLGRKNKNNASGNDLDGNQYKENMYEMFYIEQVSHAWSFKNNSISFRTTAGVSRGLKVPYAVTGMSVNQNGQKWEGIPKTSASPFTLQKSNPTNKDYLDKLGILNTVVEVAAPAAVVITPPADDNPEDGLGERAPALDPPKNVEEVFENFFNNDGSGSFRAGERSGN